MVQCFLRHNCRRGEKKSTKVRVSDEKMYQQNKIHTIKHEHMDMNMNMNMNVNVNARGISARSHFPIVFCLLP